MKIHDDHMYHGAALIQVAENKQFTAINSLKIGRTLHTNAYKINDKIGLFLKYASKKTKPHDEYKFTFTKQHLDDLEQIHKVNPEIFIAMVCVADREICCLSYGKLSKLVKSRKDKKGKNEEQYTILVTLPPKKSMRVNINTPGKKNKMLGKPIIVKRNMFPNKIFSK